MDETLERIAANIYGFQMMGEEVHQMFNYARVLGHHKLAIHAKTALNGIDGIIAYLEDAHSAIMESEERTCIPIVDESRPKLTLIRGGGK